MRIEVKSGWRLSPIDSHDSSRDDSSTTRHRRERRTWRNSPPRSAKVATRPRDTPTSGKARWRCLALAPEPEQVELVLGGLPRKADLARSATHVAAVLGEGCFERAPSLVVVRVAEAAWPLVKARRA